MHQPMHSQVHISFGESFNSMPGAATLLKLVRRVSTTTKPAVCKVDSQSYFRLCFCGPHGVLWEAESELGVRDYGKMYRFYIQGIEGNEIGVKAELQCTCNDIFIHF